MYKVTKIGRILTMAEDIRLRKSASLDSIRRSGYRYYRIIAENDSRLCSVCREQDGNIYSVLEARAGVNLPPFHPNCRCTVEGAHGMNPTRDPWTSERQLWESIASGNLTFLEICRLIEQRYGDFSDSDRADFARNLAQLYSHDPKMVEVIEAFGSGEYSANNQLIPFLDALGFRESSNDYNAVNSFGYLGKYQFGRSALIDIGFIDSAGNWTAKAAEYGVTSRETFLGNIRAQEAAMRMLMDVNWRYIKAYRLDEFIGQTMNGILITESGLLALVHLCGIGDVRRALRNGDLSVLEDRYGTRGLEYLERFGGFSLEGYQK